MTQLWVRERQVTTASTAEEQSKATRAWRHDVRQCNKQGTSHGTHQQQQKFTHKVQCKLRGFSNPDITSFELYPPLEPARYMMEVLAVSRRWQAEQRSYSLSPKLKPTNGYLVTAVLHDKSTRVVVMSAIGNQRQLPYRAIQRP